MANGNQSATVDYDALASQHGGQTAASSGVDYDSLAASHGGAAANPHATILQKYGLPESVDLTKDYFSNADKISAGTKPGIEGAQERMKRLDAFSNAWQEANPHEKDTKGFFSSIFDEAKNIFKGMASDGTGGMSMPPIPGQGAADLVQARTQQFKENPVGATARTITDVGAAALPLLIDRAPEVWSKVSPAASVEQALSTKLTAAEANTARAGGQIHPALNNTPREVLQHASDEGIKLTPGQATESGLAQNLQKAGTSAAVGGKELASAIAENKVKFGQSVNNFMDNVDPKRMGLSTEQAGQTIKETAQTAKGVAHDNATQGYQKIDYLMDKPVDGSPISAAWSKVKGALPLGVEDQILAQTPRSMRAVVEDLLSGNPEGFKPTVSQTIQLRSFFREMGETEGLPNQTQGIFRQMSQAADATAEAGTAKYGGTDDWRAANSGWKDYATKYGNPQSVLYKVLRQNDPVRTVTMLQNAPATDIATLKAEGMDAALEPLRRQVVQDIAKSRFNIAHDGLGGYSDAYLKALFEPGQMKELYLKADLAGRLKYDPNPSGTAGGLQSLEQLKLGNQAKMTTAAKLSMPRDPLSFLSTKGTPAAVIPKGNSTPFKLLSVQQLAGRQDQEAVNQ